MKLALVRSTELFGLLEQHGPRLVLQRFQVGSAYCTYFVPGTWYYLCATAINSMRCKPKPDLHVRVHVAMSELLLTCVVASELLVPGLFTGRITARGRIVSG